MVRQIWETDYYAKILDLREKNRELKELLQRVLDATVVERAHWDDFFSEELIRDLEKEIKI